MADTYNIFISWSGERSGRVAKALYDWLPMVLQTARPWMSKEDIEKGSRALEEIGKALETMSVGIICLTPENVEKPWIHFEAGALSKTMGDKTRVCPYLFGGLRGEQVKLPLGIFQAARAEEKEETRKMVLAMNRALGSVVDEDRVGTWFEREWPSLEKKLKEIQSERPAAPHVDDKKVMAEVLGFAQAGANSSAKLMEEVRDLRGAVAQVIETLRPSALFGGAGIGARSTVPLGGFTNRWPPDLGEMNVVTGNLAGSGFRVTEGLTRVGPAADSSAPGVVPNMFTPGSPLMGGNVAVAQPRPVVSPVNEQAKEEQQKKERGRMHAPSGKRAGKRGKTGDEKK